MLFIVDRLPKSYKTICSTENEMHYTGPKCYYVLMIEIPNHPNTIKRQEFATGFPNYSNPIHAQLTLKLQ